MSTARKRSYNEWNQVPVSDVTQLLVEWEHGNPEALEKLTPLIYSDLRRIAGMYMQGDRSGHMLQRTELVNEAYLRLLCQKHPHWQSREHFFRITAQMIRRILVDYTRARLACKRGGLIPKIPLENALVEVEVKACDLKLLILDQALQQLAEIDAQQAQIVELRYFAGLTIERTAEVLRISSATVKRDWMVAKAWLHREIRKEN